MADAALDAFFLVAVARSAVRSQLQGPVIDGGTKRHTTTALMAEAWFLDLMDQIGKGFHDALLPSQPKFRPLSNLFSQGCFKLQGAGTRIWDLLILV
jgi:hypothetical protein